MRVSRILFAWELGTGFGHIMPYLDVADALVRRGHRVFFASRDLNNAGSVFANVDVTFVQSPALYGKIESPRLPGHSYIDVLHNAGFSNPVHLAARLNAWRFLYESMRPDVAVFDAAPCAALAARAFDFRRITSGTGFFIPPPTSPVPALRYWADNTRLGLDKQESDMLERINETLSREGGKPIEAAHDIVDGDSRFLMNFSELDHYGERAATDYIGTFPPRSFGENYDWPQGSGPRVFAYLYPFKTIGSLFESMTRLCVRAIIYAPRLGEKMKRQYASSRLHFVDRPANVNRVLAECDAAITNGSLSSSASVLLAGKPLLTLPTTLERQIVSFRVQDLGAGLSAPQLRPLGMARKLEALLTMDRFTESAQRFAARYADQDKGWQLEQMLSRIDSVLGEPVRRATPVH